LGGSADGFVREARASGDVFASVPVAAAADPVGGLPLDGPAVPEEVPDADPAVACDALLTAFPDVLAGFDSALARVAAAFAFVDSVEAPGAGLASPLADGASPRAVAFRAASLAVAVCPEASFAACPFLDPFEPDVLAVEVVDFDASPFDEADAFCEFVALWDDSEELVDEVVPDPADDDAD